MTSSVSGELMQVREGAEGPQRRGSGRRGAKGTEKEAGLFVRSREWEREGVWEVDVETRGLHGSAGGVSERVGFRETQRAREGTDAGQSRLSYARISRQHIRWRLRQCNWNVWTLAFPYKHANTCLYTPLNYTCARFWFAYFDFSTFGRLCRLRWPRNREIKEFIIIRLPFLLYYLCEKWRCNFLQIRSSMWLYL